MKWLKESTLFSGPIAEIICDICEKKYVGVDDRTKKSDVHLISEINTGKYFWKPIYVCKTHSDKKISAFIKSLQ